MTVVGLEKLPADAMGLKLYKHNSRDELVACELVMFAKQGAVNTVLRRAGLSGRVEVCPDQIENYFADIYLPDQTWSESVALDRDSYRSLKNHWMRCKLEAQT